MPLVTTIAASATAIAVLFAALIKLWRDYQKSDEPPKSILPLDHKPRILIVDDDPKDLEESRITLNGNYEVHTYRRPFRALADLALECDRGEVFDLIILDFMMEPLSGKEMADDIRGWQRAIGKGSKIVLFTRMGKKIETPPGIAAVWRKREDSLILAQKVREVLGQ